MERRRNATAAGAAGFLLAAALTASGAPAEEEWGIGPPAPLGTPGRLGADLERRGLARQPARERRSEDLGGAHEVVAFLDRAAGERGGSPEQVQLLVDPSGDLLGVSGSFTTPAGSAAVREFLQAYWRRLAGAPPSFEKRASGAEEWIVAAEVARFSSGGARGEWVKIDASESVRFRARGKPR